MFNEFKDFQKEQRVRASENAHGKGSFEATTAELCVELHKETGHPIEACKNLLVRYNNNYNEALEHIMSLR